MKSFSKGDFIVEYAGDLVELSEAKSREEIYKKDTSYGCYMYFFNHKGRSYWQVYLCFSQIRAPHKKNQIMYLFNGNTCIGSPYVAVTETTKSLWISYIRSLIFWMGVHLCFMACSQLHILSYDPSPFSMMYYTFNVTWHGVLPCNYIAPQLR